MRIEPLADAPLTAYELTKIVPVNQRGEYLHSAAMRLIGSSISISPVVSRYYREINAYSGVLNLTEISMPRVPRNSARSHVGSGNESSNLMRRQKRRRDLSGGGNSMRQRAAWRVSLN